MHHTLSVWAGNGWFEWETIWFTLGLLTYYWGWCCKKCLNTLLIVRSGFQVSVSGCVILTTLEPLGVCSVSIQGCPCSKLQVSQHQDLQSLPWSKGSSYCQNIYDTTSGNPDMGRPTQNVTSNKAFPVISIKELLVVSFSLATGWGYNLNSNFYICSWLYGDFTLYTSTWEMIHFDSYVQMFRSH